MTRFTQSLVACKFVYINRIFPHYVSVFMLLFVSHQPPVPLFLGGKYFISSTALNFCIFHECCVLILYSKDTSRHCDHEFRYQYGQIHHLRRGRRRAN